MNKYLVILILGTLSLPASATLISSINALNPGDKYRVIFVTTTLTDAVSTNISTYDAIVQSDAAAGRVTSGLGLTWRALASTAAANVQSTTGIFVGDSEPVSFFNTQGLLLAISGGDLWNGSLFRPVSFDQNARRPEACPFEADGCVWTGTAPSGLTSRPLGSTEVVYGDTGNFDATWVTDSVTLPFNKLGLYGVSSVGVVPAIDTPEPTILPLMSLALAGLGFQRRKAA